MPSAPEPTLVRPAYLWVPEHVSSAGGEAADLAASVGLVLDPEQLLVADALLAERKGGKWAAFEAAIIAPRQNVKTFMFKVIVLADLFLFGTSRLIVWTAHEFNTANEAFEEMKQLVDAWPHLSRRVRGFSNQNGEEGIDLMSGQRLRFKARTKTGGRGLTGDRVLLDEAFALQPAHMGALMPTMSARSINGNPQILYGSSGGLQQSAVLRSIRDRGRAGGDPSLAYIEWCADEGDCATPGCDHHFGASGCLLDDQDRWAQANLALDRRISREFLAAERRSMPPEEFAREVLGWWDDPPVVGAEWAVVGEDPWVGCLVEDHDHDAALAEHDGVCPTCSIVGPVRWTIDVSPDSKSAAVAMSDGHQGEVVDYRSGSDWVVARLVELGVTEVFLDAGGPAGSLLNELEEAGITVRKVSLTEHAQACVGFLAAVDAGTFRHIGQEPLDIAAAAAVRRWVRDVWLWTRAKSGGDICPLVAVCLAVWAAQTFVEPPKKPFAMILGGA